MRKTHHLPSPEPVHEIRPTAVYFVDDLRRHLRLSRDSLTRERKAGRLRCALLNGRLMVLGEWLLEWVRSGEIASNGGSG